MYLHEGIDGRQSHKNKIWAGLKCMLLDIRKASTHFVKAAVTGLDERRDDRIGKYQGGSLKERPEGGK